MAQSSRMCALCVLLAFLSACSGSGDGANQDAGPTTADTSVDTAIDSMEHADISRGTDGCAPSCLDRECGNDGCGGSCGDCEDGFECRMTELGQRCSAACELFSCPNEQFCLFGDCVDRECATDADCGDGPEHYCDTFLQCRTRPTCASSEDCHMAKKDGYCDQTTMLCMFDGHCWDDGDCSLGTCGPDHWCEGHNCYEMFGPGCPPHAPICDMPSGEEPLCDGMPCASCVAPCVFDGDCSGGKLCDSSGTCYTPSNNCDIDDDCAAGQYCHPGCVPLKPSCETEADCSEDAICLAGFCIGGEVVPCQDDATCEVWAEGVSCQDGVCKPIGGCVLDSQCDEGEYCHGICLPMPEPPECKVDADCQPGHICQSEECRLPPECIYDVQCPDGHVCEDQQCYNDAGVCAWLEKGPDFCDDGDPCTVDTCDAVTGCVHAPGACQ